MLLVRIGVGIIVFAVIVSAVKICIDAVKDFKE